MKNMALLIDTNIVVDWIQKRESFHEAAAAVVKLCLEEKVQGFLTCHTILNLFYILRKERSVAERREILLMLCNDFNIIGIDNKMLVKALCSDDFRDLEDDLQIQCAIEEGLDYIITRDKDFKNSKVRAILPEDFLNMWRNYAQ
ncbi:MAG: PIN domain-containing protein [Clostridiales bacterium]|jgi:predicted nucleic acid-binding protein|nr:PIN domain-containing protein [Clostridiales bacterium]